MRPMHCKKSSEVAGTGTIFSLNSVDQCKEENKNIQFCWGDYGMEMENEILKRGKWEREGL